VSKHAKPACIKVLKEQLIVALLISLLSAVLTTHKLVNKRGIGGNYKREEKLNAKMANLKKNC